MKALILAAGKGTRLLPLTEKQPKPLIDFFGMPILDYLLWRISEVNQISNIAVNGHHAIDELKKHHKNSKINYFLQPETILLETGGAVGNLKKWLADDDLLIVNGDIVSDYDLQTLVDWHQSKNTLVSSFFVPHIQNSTACLLQNNIWTEIGRGSHTFCGAYILSNEFIQNVSAHRHSIMDDIKEKLSGGRLGAIEHRGYWTDMGEIQSYADSCLRILGSQQMFTALNLGKALDYYDIDYEYTPEKFFSASSHKGLPMSGQYVIGRNCDLSKITSIGSSIILNNSVVTNTKVHKQIVAPGHNVHFE